MRIRDLPAGDQQVALWWRKRRGQRRRGGDDHTLSGHNVRLSVSHGGNRFLGYSPSQSVSPVATAVSRSRWPDRIHEIMPAKFAQLDHPKLVRLYRLLSEIGDSDADDAPRLEEAADIMAGLAEQAYTPGETNLGEEHDLPFDLLDALAVESDPRAQRMLDLMRERGWASWTRTRPQRLAQPPD